MTRIAVHAPCNPGDPLALVAKGLRIQAARATAVELGDRAKYIGMSDIGRALTCFRAVIADKLNPNVVPDTLPRLLTLQRGHFFEAGIEKALRACGTIFIPQLEIAVLWQGTPVRAHLDFVVLEPGKRDSRSRVVILELKSTERLPTTLYTAYEAQVYGQIGLLKSVWNRPAFNLRNENGLLSPTGLTFPDLCRRHLGIELPKYSDQADIQAWALCLSMSDAKLFGPYTADAAMLKLCLSTAKRLWQGLAAVRNGNSTLDDMDTAQGFNPLCAFCGHNAACPKFTGSEHPEWESELQQLASLKAQCACLEQKISGVEEALKAACALLSPNGWINAGNWRFKTVPQNGRKCLDREKLRLELLRLAGSEEEADRILSVCETEGKAFGGLYVNAVHQRGLTLPDAKSHTPAMLC